MKKKEPYLRNFAYLMKYAWHTDKRLFAVSAGCAFFNAALPLIDIAGLGLVVSALTRGEQMRRTAELIFFFIAINLAISLLKQLVLYLYRCELRRASDLIQRMYARDCVYIDYHYVEDRSMLNLRRRSMGAQPAWLLEYISMIFQYVIQFAGVAYILAVLSPAFLLVVLAAAAATAWCSFRSKKIEFELKDSRAEEDRKLEYVSRCMSDRVYAKEVRINGAESFLTGKYSAILASQLKTLRAFAKKSISVDTISTAINVVQSGAMYFYFSYQAFLGRITIAEFTMYFSAVTAITSALSSLTEQAGTFSWLSVNAGNYGKLTELLEKESAGTEAANTAAKGVLRAEIAFEGVWFTYPGSDEPTLKNINLTVKNGEKLCIVGENGSGKTTLIKLLCKLYRPSKGIITVNGADIWSVADDDCRRLTAAVFQDYAEFSFTVAENVALSESPDGEKIRNILQSIGLESFADKTDTFVGKSFSKSGVELSGGEGQKLAIARALYKDSPILILDEPTASLDARAESEIYRKFFEMSEGRTTIFISHRLAASTMTDNIAVLEHGELTEYGTHAQLMKNSGIYAEMYRRQSRAYAES